MKRWTLADLEECDGVYNVARFVELSHPWVERGAALEILEVANSHLDWLLQEVNKIKETN